MRSFWPIHTLVFDLDDTLYPERDFVLSGFRAVEDGIEELKIQTSFAVIAQKFFDAGIRGNIFDQALVELKITSSPNLIARMLDVYRGHSPQLSFYPETEQFLDWAKRHFALGLISDGFLEVQRRKIRALQLERWFNAPLLTDNWGREYWKPHPRAFLETEGRFPGPAPGFAYVGDNPKKDFVGARKQGWRTFRLRDPCGEHAAEVPLPHLAPDAELSKLADLKSYITPWIPPLRPTAEILSV